MLKITNIHKTKTVDINNGFLLNINNLTKTSLNLIYQINVTEDIKKIRYSFQIK